MEIYRHGDLVFKKLDALPSGVKAVKVQDKKFVLALGEVTGHKHVMTATKDDDMKIYQDSEGRYVLQIGAPTQLSHEEHRTLTFKPGIYLMDNEREHDYFTQQSRQVLD